MLNPRQTGVNPLRAPLWGWRLIIAPTYIRNYWTDFQNLDSAYYLCQSCRAKFYFVDFRITDDTTGQVKVKNIEIRNMLIRR